MDYLATCYRVKCKPFADSDQEVTIRWFFTAPGARVFPEHHFFGSEVWRHDHTLPMPRVGESSRSRTFDKGFNPGYRGQCYVGKLEWFKTGIPTAAVPLLPQLVPPCCHPRANLSLAGDGGPMFGGWGDYCAMNLHVRLIGGLRLDGKGAAHVEFTPPVTGGLLLDGRGTFAYHSPPFIGGPLLDGSGFVAMLILPFDGGPLLDGSGAYAFIAPPFAGGPMFDGEGAAEWTDGSGPPGGLLLDGAGNGNAAPLYFFINATAMTDDFAIIQGAYAIVNTFGVWLSTPTAGQWGLFFDPAVGMWALTWNNPPVTTYIVYHGNFPNNLNPAPFYYSSQIGTGSLPPVLMLSQNPATGGLEMDGSGQEDGGYQMVACPASGLGRRVYRVTASGYTGAAAGLNGTFDMGYAGGCTWTYSAGGVQWQLNYSAMLTTWRLVGTTGLIVSTFDNATFNYLSNTVMAYFGGLLDTGHPSSLTVLPV